jgi:hypothetical protein
MVEDGFIDDNTVPYFAYFETRIRNFRALSRGKRGKRSWIRLVRV